MDSLKALCVLYATENQRAFCIYFATQKLWKSVQHWCKSHISLPHLSPKLVILEELDSSNSELILKNHLTLLFKRFVYRSRMNTSSFNFLAFKYHIRYIFKIEQKIACEKGRLNVQFDRWEPINDLVSYVN